MYVYMELSGNCKQYFLNEYKVAIVQPAASQFYVFTSPGIPASLSKAKGLLSARKNTDRRRFSGRSSRSDHILCDR